MTVYNYNYTLLLKQFTRIPEGSLNGKRKTILLLKCDVCGIKFEREYNIKKQLERSNHFCSGPTCFAKAISHDGIVDQKRKKTCRQRYGADYVIVRSDVASRSGKRAWSNEACTKRTASLKKLHASTAWQLRRGLTLCRSREEIEFLERLALELNEPCHPQKHVNGWYVDGYFAKCMLHVFYDGVYWHSKPGAAARDAKQDVWFLQHDLRFIRIKDIEWRKDQDACLQRCLAAANTKIIDT